MNQIASRIIRIILLAALYSGISFDYVKAAPEHYRSESRFHVYSGGFHLLDAILTTEVKNGLYTIGMEAAPNGWLGRMFPWWAKMQARGQSARVGAIPHEFTDQSGWEDEDQEIRLVYNQEGRLIRYMRRDPGKEMQERPIEDEMATNATDLFTAIFAVLNPKDGKLCKDNPVIFDGKRRYRVKLNYLGADQIKQTRYSSFSGKAHKCSLEVEPLAGFRAKKRGWFVVQEQNKEHKTLPIFWFAEEGKGRYRLVRLDMMTNYGAVVAHLQ